MRHLALPVNPDLEQYVGALLGHWIPDSFLGLEPEPEVSLHDLFDVPLGDNPEVEYDPELDEVFEVPDELDASDAGLHTPPVSPPAQVVPVCAEVTEEMLQCLEEIPTSDSDDEIAGEGEFETWFSGLEPGPAMGCLRCAWHQENSEERVLCGLCYLRAMSADGKLWGLTWGRGRGVWGNVLSFFHLVAGPEQTLEESQDVIFVTSTPPKRSFPDDCQEGCKRRCLEEQTEPLDLSTRK